MDVIQFANPLQLNTSTTPSTVQLDAAGLISTNDLATVTQVQAKQDSLSEGTGIHLSGTGNSVISTYGLRWDSSNTDSNNAIDTLRFEGFTTTQQVDLNAGEVQLMVSMPSTIATQSYVTSYVTTALAVTDQLGRSAETLLRVEFQH